MLDKRVEYDLGGFVFFKTCNPISDGFGAKNIFVYNDL